jgi:hypothetical protein
MRDVDAGALVDLRERDVRRRAVAGGSSGELARLLLRQSDQVGKGLHGQRRIGNDDKAVLAGPQDRHEIAQGVVVERAVEREIRRERRVRRHQQRVAVSCRLGDDLGADAPAGARPVVDDHLLTERLRHLAPERSRQEIDRAARGVRHHDGDRALRIAGERRRVRRDRSRRHDQELQSIFQHRHPP